MRHILLLSFLITFLICSCKKAEIFPALGDKVASPIDVATDKNAQYFYALNSDYPRDYNQGSLLILNTEGEKVGVVPLPRLGRSLTVAGDALIITVSYSGEAAQQIMLFDITDPKKPVLAKSFSPQDCNPINAVVKDGYAYWAVSCSNGKIMAGDLASPLANSTLQVVRNYYAARRALHIDTARNLLFAFATDLGDQQWADAILTDSKTYKDSALTTSDAPDGTETAVANEIPDNFERTRSDRSNKARRGMYQFMALDLKDSHDNGWVFKDVKETYSEQHWTYFSLSNFDGTPDVAQTISNIDDRYYRTNFWEAKADLEDSDVFYLSHRGSPDARNGGSKHANSIIKVRVVGDFKATAQTTDDLLSFERIYGFKGELEPNGRHYPGDFEIANVQGKPLLLVNHFRDLVNWPGQGYFSIAAKVIGEHHWFSEISSTSVTKTYYQIALTPTGRALAANFYGNSLILLDVAPGVGITEKAINIQ